MLYPLSYAPRASLDAHQHPTRSLAFDARKTLTMKLGFGMELEPIPVAAALAADDPASPAAQGLDLHRDFARARARTSARISEA